jgi:hypothetical protein
MNLRFMDANRIRYPVMNQINLIKAIVMGFLFEKLAGNLLYSE